MIALSEEAPLHNSGGSQTSINGTAVILGVLALVCLPFILGYYSLEWQKNQHRHERLMSGVRVEESTKERLEKSKERRVGVWKAVCQGMIQLISKLLTTAN